MTEVISQQPLAFFAADSEEPLSFEQVYKEALIVEFAKTTSPFKLHPDKMNEAIFNDAHFE